MAIRHRESFAGGTACTLGGKRRNEKIWLRGFIYDIIAHAFELFPVNQGIIAGADF